MWRRKTNKVARYATLFARIEKLINQRAREFADWLRMKTDPWSLHKKYIVFMIFCAVISTACTYIIINA